MLMAQLQKPPAAGALLPMISGVNSGSERKRPSTALTRASCTFSLSNVCNKFRNLGLPIIVLHAAQEISSGTLELPAVRMTMAAAAFTTSPAGLPRAFSSATEPLLNRFAASSTAWAAGPSSCSSLAT